MIEPTEHAEGVVLPIRAQPGARRNQIVGAWNHALKIAVTAPPDQGKANQAIIDVLVAALKVKKSQVELIAGFASRDKKVLLRGISVEKATEWLVSLGLPAEE